MCIQLHLCPTHANLHSSLPQESLPQESQPPGPLWPVSLQPSGPLHSLPGPSVVSLFLMMPWCSLLADLVASGSRLRQALLAAKTPGFATTAEHAASRVHSAVAAGRAEIAIAPQAWLIALTAGLLPESTQFAAGLVNYFMLPASPNTRHPDEFD
jgi:hypothetical protein